MSAGINNEFSQRLFEILASKPYCVNFLGQPLLIRPKYQVAIKVYKNMLIHLESLDKTRGCS